MNKTPLLLLLLLLVVGAGAFLVWTVGAGDVAPNAPEAWLENDPDQADPIRATGGAGDEDPMSGELTEGLRQVVLEEGKGANTRTLVVQVVEAGTGVPAPEVDVHFVDGYDGPELSDPFAPHWTALAEDRGLRFKTDAQGLAELPAIQDWAVVTAQRAGAYGFAKLGPAHRDLETITLLPDETVTVRVVDGDDRPAAGVPVGIVQHVPVQQEILQQAEELRIVQQQLRDVAAWIEANPDRREEAVGKMTVMRRRAARLTDALSVGKADMAAQKAGRVPPRRIAPQATATHELRAQRLTDEDGIAVFRHFQLYRHERQDWWPASHVDQFEAALLMPLQQPESVAFAGRPVPEETLELRLPATGSIALRTVDLDGRPYTAPVQALLQMTPEPVPWARVQDRSEQNEGQIVFPFVGLGLSFTARCRLDDSLLGKGGLAKAGSGRGFDWNTPPFVGPLSAGERVTIDLVVAPDAGMLFGRLVDDAGEPLVSARPAFSIASQAGQLESQEVTLDDEGRFHMPYEVEQQDRGPFRLVIRRNDVKPTAGLAMTLPLLPTGRVTDLGDLRIGDFGSIAYGKVVDDRGQPVPGALLQLQRERQVEGRPPAQRRVRTTRARQPRGPQTRMDFVNEPFVSDRTDTEGNYQLFGELEPGRYRLRAQSVDHFAVETPDLRPGQQLDLQLMRTSQLVGTVVTPDWMPANSVRARLELATDPRQQREDQLQDGKGNGPTAVWFDRVRAGSYNLSLSVLHFPDPILQISGIEVRPGQRGVHERLQDLDLGALVYHFDVNAIDENGQPFKPSAPVLLARIARMDGSMSFVGIAWGRGGSRAEIISASAQLEVIPFSEGYRAERTVLTAGRSQLQYLRIPPVDLHMPGLRAMIGTETAWIEVQLVGGSGLPDELDTWDQRSDRIANWYRETQSTIEQLRQSDSLELSLMTDGRYQVIMHLGNKAQGIRPVRVELGDVELELEPGAASQRVTVPYQTEQVQAGITELARRRNGF